MDGQATRAAGPAGEPRRRMVPDDRRREILACARRVFGEKAYAEVAVSEIAAQAGVARGLINHYFGGKRQLYLEVLAAMVAVPEVTLEVLPKGSLEERADGIVDHFLTVVHRNRGIWLTTVRLMSQSTDDDVAKVTFEAEERTADLVLEALGMSPAFRRREEARAMIRAYGSMVRAASHEWLARGTLSRTQTHRLLVSALVTLAGEIENLAAGGPALAGRAAAPGPA
ncbi:MAG TPA: helix-turn-helix domain-containing protein [Rugosimonospora sp.]|nr:helix-turn-helix domain-containing protein [Rugosimonospora sp.]